MDKTPGGRKDSFYWFAQIELLTAQVSDTTVVDSSNAADYKIIILNLLIVSPLILAAWI